MVLSRYTWWLGTLAALAVLMALAGQFRALDPIQGLFLGAAQPLERATGAVARPVADLLGSIGELDDFREENRQLRLENEALKVRVAELQADLVLGAEIREALQLLQADEAGSSILATVVHRDGSTFADTISINRGRDDGITEGMVVLSAQGSLLGSVTDSLPGQAFVRLVTDSRSRVAGQTTETQADGIVRGELGGGLSLSLARAEVRGGDVIVTSGIGGNYPPGIPIGTVTEVEGSAQDLFQKVSLEPLVRPSTVRTVIVLEGFLPETTGLTE